MLGDDADPKSNTSKMLLSSLSGRPPEGGRGVGGGDGRGVWDGGGGEDEDLFGQLDVQELVEMFEAACLGDDAVAAC